MQDPKWVKISGAKKSKVPVTVRPKMVSMVDTGLALGCPSGKIDGCAWKMMTRNRHLYYTKTTKTKVETYGSRSLL